MASCAPPTTFRTRATPTRLGSTRARPTPRTRRTRSSCGSTLPAPAPPASTTRQPSPTGKLLGGLHAPAPCTKPAGSCSDGTRRHLHLGRGQEAGARPARPAARRPGRAQHPDAGDRPVRQVPAGPARAAAVRDHPTGPRFVEGQPRGPGAGSGQRAALRHAVPDRHRAQRRPVRAGHQQDASDTFPTPDTDTTIQTDFMPAAARAPTTTSCSNSHFACGDGRCNENIALSSIHPVFHSEHDRLVDYIKNVLETDTSADRRRGSRAVEGHWRPGCERHRRLRLR